MSARVLARVRRPVSRPYCRATDPRRGQLNAAIVQLFKSGEPGAMFVTKKPNDVYRRVNELTYSEQFTNAAWAATSSTVTDNVALAPSGKVTAALMTDNGTANGAFDRVLTAVPGRVITFSKAYKRGSDDWLRLMAFETASSSNQARIWVNLATGEYTTSQGGTTVTLVAGVAVAVEEGFYRVSLSFMPSVTGVTVRSKIVTGSGSATGINGSTFYMAEAQLEKGAVATAYQRVTDWTTEFLYAGLDYTRRNELNYSQDYSNAGWAKTNFTAYGLTGATCPDGAPEWSFTEGVTASMRGMTTGDPTVARTISTVVRRGDFDWIRFMVTDPTGGTGGCRGWFNLATGQKGAVQNFGTGSGAATSIEDLGGGNYRLKVSGIVGGAGTQVAAYLISADADGSTTRASGGNGGTYYRGGTQMELGTIASAYQPVTDGSEFIPQVNPALTMFTDHQGVTPLTALEQTMGLQLDVRPIFLGPNIAANPTFDTDLSGWSAGVGWTWDATGKAKLTGDGTPAGLTQSNLIAGRQYEFAFDVSADGTGIAFQDHNGAILASGTSGRVTGRFVSPATTWGFKRAVGIVNGTVDNVSVREVIASPNAVGTPLRGPELITDPGFDNASAWALTQPASGSTSIAGGVLTINTLDGSNSVAVLNGVAPLAGMSYEYTVQVTAAGGFGVQVQVGSTAGPAYTAPGTYRAIIRAADASNIQVKRAPGGAASGTVTLLSVKPVHGNPRSQATSSARSKVTARYNKIIVPNANPTGTTGLSKAGSDAANAVLSVVNDAAAIATAPAEVQRLCTLGTVYKLDNSAGSSQVQAQFGTSTVGTNNRHVFSAYIRNTGIATIGSGTAAQGVASFDTTAKYTLRSVEVNAASTTFLSIRAEPGAVVYFILPDAREACYSYLPTPQVVWDSTTGYDDEGFPARIQRLGTHGEATAVIPFSSCQQAQMFWASGKMSDAVTGIVIECGTAANFTLNAPRSVGVGNYGTDLRAGGNTATSQSPSSYPASHAAVVVGLVDTTQATIAGQTRTLVNGAESVATSGTLVPVGTYFTDETVSFGCRGAGGVISAGSTTDEFASIVRGGATPDAATINMVTRVLAAIAGGLTVT